MGVPVVTLAGERPASRSAASIITAAGYPRWIAASPEEYVSIAAELARQGPAQAALRREIRRQFQASPVMDEAVFTRDLEAAFRSAWKRWCTSSK
jgi:predicted O-linked N-acetylglucosamine transferase (SPINDLY family)